MKIIIAMPTRTPKDPLLSLAQDYLVRARPPFGTAPLFLATKVEDDPIKRKALEAEHLLKKTQGYYRIALSENGKNLNSERFAEHLARLVAENKVAFLIGGAFGLAPEVLKECKESLCLSPMTLPHRLAFLLLSEQIFRASEITRNSSYHK